MRASCRQEAKRNPRAAAAVCRVELKVVPIVRGKRKLLGWEEAPLVVTGTGLVSAAGAGVTALERCLESGESRLGPLDDGRAARPSPWGWNRLDPGWVGG